MKKTTTLMAAGLFALGLAASPATAAPPTTNWTGFYAGGHVGYGWGNYDYSVTGLGPSWGGVIPGFIRTNGSPDLNGSGLTGGLLLGANLQHGRIVLGAESDFSWMSLKKSYLNNLQNPNNSDTRNIFEAESSVSWLATVRPRIGVLVTDNFLPYITGGLAFGMVQSSWTMTARATSFGVTTDSVYAASSSGVRTGWVFGGGFEYALQRNWTLRLDYLHVDLGTEDFRTSTPDGQGATHYIDVSAKTVLDFVRVGANYRF